jgi:hypothetical protein
MRRLTLALAALAVGVASAWADPLPVGGQAETLATVNGSVSITTGNTFQTVLAAVTGGFPVFNPGGIPTGRRSLTIENNNTNGDNCWIFIGSGTATKATSMLLGQGGSYTRYWPYVPSDVIQATCASNSDTLYVDTQ